MDSNSFEFTYHDTDSYQNEISEIYAYCEDQDFVSIRNSFEELMEDCGLPLAWKHMVKPQQSMAISHLLTNLDVSCRTTRIRSCKALAYLIQGTFGECQTIEEQADNCRENVFLLYEQGIFQAFVQQLLIEFELSSEGACLQQQQQPNQTTLTSQNSDDYTEIRLILSVLCTITETIYHAKDNPGPKIQELRNQFRVELQNPFGDEILPVILFQMLNKFCSGASHNCPVKKITLLLWKVLLISLGGTDTLKELKDERRLRNNLPPLPDETLEVTKNMRPCSPPATSVDKAHKIGPRALWVTDRRKVTKQDAFDHAVLSFAKECLMSSFVDLNNSVQDGEKSDPDPDSDDQGFYLNDVDKTEMNDEDNGPSTSSDNEDEVQISELMSVPLQSPDATSSDSGIIPDDDNYTSADRVKQTAKDDIDGEGVHDHIEDIDVIRDADDEAALVGTTANEKPLQCLSIKQLRANADNIDGSLHYRGLPWAPKVRKADLSQHISNIRQKFLGYTLPDDLNTTYGLPGPIIEGIDVLKKHLYTSLSEIQLEREDAIEKFPLTFSELDADYHQAPTEKLYASLLPKLPQYMITLLKIILASSTASGRKIDRTDRSDPNRFRFKVGSDIDSSIVQYTKAEADLLRHREIIIKAVSAILILLLKHFKVNHIYQFEYVSQQLMFANCIPLILKFLSQDSVSSFVELGSNIPACDFPTCVIGDQPDPNSEVVLLCQSFAWRNMFSCINLVRVLNKLTKWKHSRIMMLVVFKSAPTLTKALSVREPIFQLYVLKLLKMQLKFLGRQWKKSNMKLISAIYQKVRHRLTDDWAYSNDNEAKPWDFQSEEFTLQANINKFHQRRYHAILAPNGRARYSLMFNQDKFGYYENEMDYDYDLNMHDESQLTPLFKRNYERWLDSEVFQRQVDWDKLLGS